MSDRYPIRNKHIEAAHTITPGEIISRPMTPEEWEKYGPKFDKIHTNVMNVQREVIKPMENKVEPKESKAESEVSKVKRKDVKFDTQKVVGLIKKYGIDSSGKNQIAKELGVYPYYIDRLITQKRFENVFPDKKPSIKEQLIKDIAKELKVSTPKNPKKQLHMDLCADLHETFVAKNTAYGDSFHVTFQEFGVISALTRMSDKWNRIKALATGARNDVKDESITDSLMDLANYCVMTVMELKGE